jgi:hypothetical protein
VRAVDSICHLSRAVKVIPREFGAIVRLHTSRLLSRWTRTQIGAIEQEHQQLISSCDGEPSLKSSTDAMDSSASFDYSWKLVINRLKLLEKFPGGIACDFRVIAQIKSDFSIVKLDKYDFRMFITDLSLEGVLHANHHEYLKFNVVPKPSATSFHSNDEIIYRASTALKILFLHCYHIVYNRLGH